MMDTGIVRIISPEVIVEYPIRDGDNAPRFLLSFHIKIMETIPPADFLTNRRYFTQCVY